MGCDWCDDSRKLAEISQSGYVRVTGCNSIPLSRTLSQGPEVCGPVGADAKEMGVIQK